MEKAIVVRKSNDLIQKSRFNLSLQQQKILLYIISLIQPTDTEFQEYQVSIKDFCEICNIDHDSGKNYADIKEKIKEIADKSLWVKLADGRETLLRWIEKAKIENGVIKVRLDNDMKPFLLQLNKNYTMYELVWTLNFQSKYSIRLYELIKSLHYNELQEYSRVYPVEELKKLLSADTYKSYSDFRLRVLEPAIKEINTISDKQVSYRVAKKTGKRITHIELVISSLMDTVERMKRYYSCQKDEEKNDV